jgi:hypothetical protein
MVGRHRRPAADFAHIVPLRPPDAVGMVDVPQQAYTWDMESVVRNVWEINQQDRSALERIVGQDLRENQRLIIQVAEIDVPQPNPVPALTRGHPRRSRIGRACMMA